VDQAEDELMDMQPQPSPEALEEAPQDETEEPPLKRQKKGPVTKLLGDLYTDFLMKQADHQSGQWGT